MLADGDEIPHPSTLETILIDRDHQDAVAFIPIELSEAIFNHQELCLKV